MDWKKYTKDELIKWDLEHLWHPFTQMKEWSAQPPLFIARGEGNHLVDLEGKRYIDGVASLWANIHGHGRVEITRAIEQQLKELDHSTLLGLTHPSASILAKRLTELAPPGLRWVFYSESGSTAVEIALKMAFQYWQNKGHGQKTKFICLKEGYHGDTLGAVSVGGIGLFHDIYGPLLFESIKLPCPYLRCKEAGVPLQEGSELCASDLEKILHKHHHETAAFILEPRIQGAGGMLPAPPGYLKAARELCTEFEVLLIADEVATGFGRTGAMFACEAEGVSPDILCLGKGITGGYLPLAATLCTHEIFQAFWADYQEFKTFFHGHTYTGNPLACAAAIASLDLFEKDQTLETLKPKIELLASGLEALRALPWVGEVRQVGMMAGVEIFQDPEAQVPYPLEKRMGHRVCMTVRKHGVILRNLGDTIVILPPLSIEPQELEQIITSVQKAIHEVCGSK